MIERASDRNAPTLVPDLAVYPHNARFSIIFRFVHVWRDSLVILSATVLLVVQMRSAIMASVLVWQNIRAILI